MKNYQLCAFTDEAGSSLDAQIFAMKDNGISSMEIRGVGGKNVSSLTRNEAKDIKDTLAAEGLSIWSIGSPLGKISIKDDFAPHLDLFKHTLELADVLGVSCIRLFSFYTPKGENREVYKDEVVERLSRFCEAAKGSGVLLCHENEKDIYGEDADSCLVIHRALPELKAVFDPANFIQCGQETVSAFELLSPYIHYMHIKDALSNGSVVPAGKGEGKIPLLLSQYEKIGGSVLTIEPHLTVFEGLSALEGDNKSMVGAYTYPSQRVAFDAAVSALKELL